MQKTSWFVVIEISSFQAELINIKRKFDCLIYTSLTENHSDKYLSYDEYKLAKKDWVILLTMC